MSIRIASFPAPSGGRGRDAGYPAPPAQIPACGTTAPGSCLGSNVQAPKGACRTQSNTCDRENPALCPAPGMLDHIPLGQLPSLHLLRRSHRATLVRRLPRYYEAVRLPTSVHHGRTPWVHRAGLAITSGQMQGLPGSVHSVAVHARGLRPRQVCPPLAIAGCAVSPSACSERVGTQDWPISGLNTLPAPSPVNASRLPLPRATHDSGPV